MFHRAILPLDGSLEAEDVFTGDLTGKSLSMEVLYLESILAL